MALSTSDNETLPVSRAEKALARAEHDRVDHQEQFVDLPAGKQGPDELTATHDHEVAAGLAGARQLLRLGRRRSTAWSSATAGGVSGFEEATYLERLVQPVLERPPTSFQWPSMSA